MKDRKRIPLEFRIEQFIRTWPRLSAVVLGIPLTAFITVVDLVLCIGMRMHPRTAGQLLIERWGGIASIIKNGQNHWSGRK